MDAIVVKLPNANLNFGSASTFKKCRPKPHYYNIPFLKANISSPITSSVVKKKICTKSSLAHVWRKIQGVNNWENLVEPLDNLLRQEIIRYGEFVSACYKTFDLDSNSKRYLNCKYGKKNMLHEVGLGESGYEVTKYIYATPDIKYIPIQTSRTCCGRWIGYVAVSNDDETKKLGRRDALITFRGTVTNLEWIANFMSSLSPARLDPHNPRTEVKVEAGFLSLYTSNESECKFGLPSCRDQLLLELSRILKMYKGEEMSITIAGHSMGSSLALLLAYDISELGMINTRNTPITVFPFGGPRVGNIEFKKRCEELGVKVLRIVNINDPITKLPGVFFNESTFKGIPLISCSCYTHVGVELILGFFKMQNPSCVHDLETYINFLKNPLDLKTRRDDFGFLLHKAKALLLNAQFFNELWPTAALNMLELVQSQRL
ncbi:hypothetical protein M9H77_30716 [Catharanthus roseus]|uniref:Uncharacterized protein n=1 Tax=Catharanthus roseus TaxID=4058 RepID=A0ACB9ZYD1_CATRO|nr:hypothetical protein M9H77_30716 [Catharanthus roseus]